MSHIQNAYLFALQSIPLASLVISLNSSLNKTFSFIDFIEIDKFIPIKLIHFLRSMSGFESLHDQDRLALVKYNFILLLLLHDALVHDPKNDLFYDDTG